MATTFSSGQANAFEALVVSGKIDRSLISTVGLGGPNVRHINVLGTLDRSASPEQIVKINELGFAVIRTVVASLGLCESDAARILENRDELTNAIRLSATSALVSLSTQDKFKKEEVPSDYTYQSGYEPGFVSVASQFKRLHELFPETSHVDFHSNYRVDLHNDAEGLFVIPRWQKVAQTYNQAVEKVLGLIKKTSRGMFENCREGQLDFGRFCQVSKTENAFYELSVDQGNGDFVIFPAQFGVRHRGRSVRRVREILPSHEFGLGAFATGVMLLTHPNRLLDHNDLYIDCPGDRFDEVASSTRFDHAPLFSFSRGKIKFGAFPINDTTGGGCGSASGFMSSP